MSELHGSYNPLQYHLMFSKGEVSYYLTIPLNNNDEWNKKVSYMQFYAYRLMVRDNCDIFLHYFKNLFNQYFVDIMGKMTTEILPFICNNQKQKNNMY